MKFTDDPYVHETLSFLMIREVAHFKMFEAALDSIQPNFPPAVLQADPRYTQQYLIYLPAKQHVVIGMKVKCQEWVKWEYIEEPINHVKETQGLSTKEKGMDKELSEMEKKIKN